MTDGQRLTGCGHFRSGEQSWLAGDTGMGSQQGDETGEGLLGPQGALRSYVNPTPHFSLKAEERRGCVCSPFQDSRVTRPPPTQIFTQQPGPARGATTIGELSTEAQEGQLGGWALEINLCGSLTQSVTYEKLCE